MGLDYGSTGFQPQFLLYVGLECWKECFSGQGGGGGILLDASAYKLPGPSHAAHGSSAGTLPCALNRLPRLQNRARSFAGKVLHSPTARRLDWSILEMQTELFGWMCTKDGPLGTLVTVVLRRFSEKPESSQDLNYADHAASQIGPDSRTMIDWLLAWYLLRAEPNRTGRM